MVQYPLGHVWGISLTLEFVPPALMRQTEATGFITLPEDLTNPEVAYPEINLGLVVEAQSLHCVKCRLPWAQVQWETTCIADDPKQRDHLRGGKRDRAWRTTAAPGTSAAEVARRQETKRHREHAAQMQQSRIPDFI